MTIEPRLHRVILSSGGVGQFEFIAEVSGNADLVLKVQRNQVDDILKSLSVSDPTGKVTGVSLPGMYPVHEAFKNLPIEPEDFSSVKLLLEKLRGAEVRISGAAPVVGRIVAVEAVPNLAHGPMLLENSGDFATDMHLYVMTGAGLSRVVLADATLLEFADPALKAALDAGLAALAAHSTDDRRELTVSLQGTGERTARLSFVVEAPLWKVAYRLLLAGDEARLQGWAVVENQGSIDWSDVELVLISGNPVTIRQELYKSNYVQRDNVSVDHRHKLTTSDDRYRAPAADADEGRQLQDWEAAFAPESDGKASDGSSGILTESEVDALLDSVQAPEPEFADLDQLDSMSVQSILRNLGQETLVVALSGAPDTLRERFLANMSERAAAMIRDDILANGALNRTEIDTAQDTVVRITRDMAARGEIVLPMPAPRPQPLAAGTPDRIEPEAGLSNVDAEVMEATTQVAIRFTDQVRVAAGHSAALPFIDTQIAARRLALYRASAHPRNPLAAIRIANVSSTTLPPGIVTLYDSDAEIGLTTYIGDAVMPAIPADENRVVSFALDQKTVVDRERRMDDVVRQAEIVNGYLRHSGVARETVLYRLRGPTHEPRTVLIDHPRREGWSLKEPEAVEQTARHHRIEVELAPGERRDVAVTLETPRRTEVNITSLSELDFALYTKAAELPQAQRAFLAKLADLMEEKRKLGARIKELRRERQDIHEDLEEIRENMGFNPSWRTRRRYRDTLAAQEDKLASIGDETRGLERRMRETDSTVAERFGAWDDGQ